MSGVGDIFRISVRGLAQDLEVGVGFQGPFQGWYGSGIWLALTILQIVSHTV